MLILMCDVVTKRKFKLVDILNCYILGFINLIPQSFRVSFENTFVMFIYDAFTALVIMSLLLYIYYNLIVFNDNESKRLNLLTIVAIQAINFIFVAFTVNIINNVFNEVFTYVYKNGYYEFISNISLRVLEAIMIVVVLLYKKNKGVN